MAQDSVKAVQLSTFNSAAVLANYQPVNVGGFPYPCFLVRIVNASNAAITVSYDGVTDNEYLPANSLFIFEPQTNSQPNARFALISARTEIFIKGAAGAGIITVSGYYV